MTGLTADEIHALVPIFHAGVQVMQPDPPSPPLWPLSNYSALAVLLTPVVAGERPFMSFE